MKWGDISNEPAPAIGIRFEEIIRRGDDGKLNRTGKAFCERLVGRDVALVLFTTGTTRKAQAYSYKWGVPYNGICAVDSVLELVQVCIEQKLIQYWDTDKDILSKINARHRGTEIRLWTLQDNSFLE